MLHNKLKPRRATKQDIPVIIKLLKDDILGKDRESELSEVAAQNYYNVFSKIDSDNNQYLMIVENVKEIVETYHCTLIPSMTFNGSLRMQI